MTKNILSLHSLKLFKNSDFIFRRSGRNFANISSDSIYLNSKANNRLCHIPKFSSVKTVEIQCANKFSTTKQREMRFVQFSVKGGPQRLGVQLQADSDVIDVSTVDLSIPNNLLNFLQKQQDEDVLTRAKR